MNQKYFQISNDGTTILDTRWDINAIPRQNLAPNKNYWLPVYADETPTVNNASFYVSDPQYEIFAGHVREYRTLVKRTITTADINQERDRRIYEPKTVSLTTGKIFRVDMLGGGRENVGQLGTAAIAKSIIGNTSTFSFRDADNTDQTLTNEEVIEMGLQIMGQIQAIHIIARGLKASLPWDYWNDEHWSQ